MSSLLGICCWHAFYHHSWRWMDDTVGKRILGLIPRKNIVTYVCSTEYCFNLLDFKLFILSDLPEGYDRLLLSVRITFHSIDS